MDLAGSPAACRRIQTLDIFISTKQDRWYATRLARMKQPIPIGHPSQRRQRAQTDAIGKRLYSDEDLMIAQQVSDVAEAHGLPMTQVAIAWMLSKPVVTTPINGATKPYHLDDAVAALSVQLTPEEIQQLEEAYQPHPILGYA